MAQQVAQVYQYAIPISKSDTVNFPLYQNRLPDAIWVGGAGIVALIFPNSAEVDFTCVAGSILPIQGALRVNSTTTTATLMVALYLAA